MAADWRRAFDAPIATPDGRKLHTLREGARQVIKFLIRLSVQFIPSN
jgi:hypothetical protein